MLLMRIEVVKVIKKIKSRKAAGFDVTTVRFLKKAGDVIVKCYRRLFNMCLNSVVVPGN